LRPEVKMHGLAGMTRRLFHLRVKSYSTAVGVNVFKDGKHAEFLAAAASLSSIPALHGLPEVSTSDQVGTKWLNRSRSL